MKALILAAGQGRRLLPLTEERPKALLDIGGQELIAWQVQEFVKAGVADFAVLVGFKAHLFEPVLDRLGRQYSHCRFRTIFNPFYSVSDNLASCWMLRPQMDGDFLLVNGDTLFPAAALETLFASPAAPVTVTIDKKAHYDDDDMKVVLKGTRLTAIGKHLDGARIDGESIGLLYFRGEGPALFAEMLDRVVRESDGLRKFFLSAIGELAGRHEVQTQSIEGKDWQEVDYPLDLERARALVAEWGGPLEADETSATAQ